MSESRQNALRRWRLLSQSLGSTNGFSEEPTSNSNTCLHVFARNDVFSPRLFVVRMTDEFQQVIHLHFHYITTFSYLLLLGVHFLRNFWVRTSCDCMQLIFRWIWIQYVHLAQSWLRSQQIFLIAESSVAILSVVNEVILIRISMSYMLVKQHSNVFNTPLRSSHGL